MISSMRLNVSIWKATGSRGPYIYIYIYMYMTTLDEYSEFLDTIDKLIDLQIY